MAVVNSILITFFLLFFFESNEVESWKMKVCLNGTVYSAEEYKCKAGVWFTEPRLLGSLCFDKGTWALYEEWCQSNPIIWSAYPQTKGCISHLYLKNIKIAGIVYLGNENNGGQIATSGRRLFLNNSDLKRGKTFDLVDDNTFEVLTWGTNAFAVEQHRGFSRLQNCLMKPRTVFFGYYKFELDEIHNLSIYVQENLCLDSKFRGDRIQKKPNKMQFKVHGTSQKESSTTWETKEPCKPEFAMPAIGQEDYLDYSQDATRTATSPTTNKNDSDVVRQNVDDQSQRIGAKFYASKFYHELPVEMFDFMEWKFLEIGKKIFKKTCPTTMVPELYLDDIFLLFKFLLEESFTLFPPNVDPDNATRLRILRALKKCEASGTSFVFKNGKSCSKTPLLKFKARNGTTILQLLQVPRQIKINVEKFDLILESVWKIMLFIHYYCAESSFNEFSSDLSVLQNRWQSLIAPDLIRRWKNPGSSYDMMQRLFMNMDLDLTLEKTIQNLDHCVGAAHVHSSYKGWLKRPLTKSELRNKNATQQDLIWDGQAYCAMDYTYPAEKLGFPLEKCGIRFSN